MPSERILDLREVGEFRQTLAARPPAFVHGTAVLVTALVVGVVLWAWFTEANLVVRGAARVRPAVAPLKSFEEVSNQQLFAEVGGRVVEIAIKDGQRVARGDVLVRLDTERIANEIAQLGREIDANAAEVAALDRLSALADAQSAAALARAEAEVTRAAHEVHRSHARLSSDARLAQVELDDALREQARAQELVERNAGAAADVTAAGARVARAREKLAATQIGVDGDEPEILRRGVEQARRDHEFKLADMARERAAKQGQVEASRKRLANLELERDRATIRAHKTGIVSLGGLAVGDVVGPGKLALAITEEGGVRVDAAVAASEVAHLRVGMPVRIKLDAFDYQRYGTVDGSITYIAADTSVASDGHTPYYLVSVALVRDDIGAGDHHGVLKVGMTGQIEAITSRERLLSLFLKNIRQSVSL